MSCRGIHFDGNNCRILYETIDVVESERNKYHQVSLSSNEGNELLMNGKESVNEQVPRLQLSMEKIIGWSKSIIVKKS